VPAAVQQHGPSKLLEAKEMTSNSEAVPDTKQQDGFPKLCIAKDVKKDR